jgi:hypothetical protein
MIPAPRFSSCDQRAADALAAIFRADVNALQECDRRSLATTNIIVAQGDFGEGENFPEVLDDEGRKSRIVA